MRDIKKILELRAQNFSQRAIARMLQISRNSVSTVFKAADEKNLVWSLVASLSEKDLSDLLFRKEDGITTVIKQPDYDYVHRELLKAGTNLKLLWEEYRMDCISSSVPFYQYSYFADKYRDYVKKNNLTMHISHKPGDKMMVDWNGKTMEVYDRDTGEVYTAYLFEATLPFSMYSYVQACPSMNIENWIDCHVNAYLYFGGVTRLLIPDNLKTGVISHKKYEDPVLNKTYQEMADHYHTNVVPARVRKPKDKAAVEGAVGDCTTAVIGRLRNRKFFSFSDLNKAILEKLDDFNAKPFQKKEGSRKSVYLDEEYPFMQDLPSAPFEMSSWKRAKVQINYHIAIDKMYYSVPYEYVGSYVDVKMTKSTIAVYYKSAMIASHARIHGRAGQYLTSEAHMPLNHQQFQWNRARYLKWALSFGPKTEEVVNRMFDRCRVEEQAYNGVMSLLKLGDKFGKTRLEDACQLALDHLSKPGYKNIKAILESNQDIKEKERKTSLQNADETAFVRGADYYGGKINEH